MSILNFWRSLVFEFLFQFLINKSQKFRDLFSLLFDTVFYSRQSTIPEFTVLVLKLCISKQGNIKLIDSFLIFTLKIRNRVISRNK